MHSFILNHQWQIYQSRQNYQIYTEYNFLIYIKSKCLQIEVNNFSDTPFLVNRLRSKKSQEKVTKLFSFNYISVKRMAVKIVSICSSISLKVMKCFFIKENYAIFVHMASLQPTKKKIQICWKQTWLSATDKTINRKRGKIE